MADRYQERRFPADDYDRGGDPRAPASDEGDPLAELARLIGQTDPFGSMGRANQQVPPRTSAPRDQYQPPSQYQPAPQYQSPPQYQPPQYQHPAEPDPGLRAGAPTWLQRASRQEIPEQDSLRIIRARCIRCSAMRRLDHHPNRITGTRRPTLTNRKPIAMTMCCMAGLMTPRSNPRTIRAMRTTTTPIRTVTMMASNSKSRNVVVVWLPWSLSSDWQSSERAPRLRIGPMSDHHASAIRRSSGPIPVRPRSFQTH